MGTQYSDRVVEGMQALYGKGFLSPGGSDEMTVLLDGVDLSGDAVLDVGCGLGGAAIMLAGEFGARHVTSIDIAEDLVARATAEVRSTGLAERVNAIHVTPGPLPFGDAAFDVVFVKDVVCHIEDKEALFNEAARVLRPGGRVVCADFIGPDGQGEPVRLYKGWIDAMKAYGLTFHFERLGVYREAFRRAGLEDVMIRDDTERSLKAVEREVAFVTGPDAGSLEEALGDEKFAQRIEASARRLEALAGGGIFHMHMVARRPESA